MGSERTLDLARLDAQPAQLELGIEPAQTMVVGDNDNDLPMFALVGLSVAMGQATPAVQRAADWVAPSVYEHGVAAALERFLLAEPTGS